MIAKREVVALLWILTSIVLAFYSRFKHISKNAALNAPKARKFAAICRSVGENALSVSRFHYLQQDGEGSRLNLLINKFRDCPTP